jgi:hypothetical protein
MKRIVFRIFLWSWLLTVPVTVVGGYLAFRSFDRFLIYGMRYSSPLHDDLSLGAIGEYEMNRMSQRIRAGISSYFRKESTGLKPVYLFVPESNLSKLESHMPQSGYDYVKGRMLIDGKLEKVQIKYRGDSFWRWAWDKKSMRVKTSRQTLFEGMRSVNFLAARSPEQLNNYLSYRLADLMGLITPRTDLVRVFLNGKDRGVYFLVEQPKEIMLRHRNLMPGDLYRGELIPMTKDDFRGGGIRSLFDSAAVWDKIAVNNHYDEDAKAPLTRLIELIADSTSGTAQAALGEMLDMQVWGRYAAYESLTQSIHADEIHNWRLYYDPWRQKFLPVVWDTMGWFDRVRNLAFRNEVISNSLMKALFQNGDFVRARSDALWSFFATGKDQIFLGIVADAVEIVEKEIQTDPFLLPADPDNVTHHMRRLESVVEEVLGQKNDIFLDNDPRLGVVYASAQVGGHSLDLVVRGTRPIQWLRLKLSETLKLRPQVSVTYQTATAEHSVDLSGSVKLSDDHLVIGGGFLPDLFVESQQGSQGYLRTSPGFYRLRFEGLSPNVKILSAEIDRGEGWLPVESVAELEFRTFGSLYAPVAAQPLLEPIVWSGAVAFEGHQTLEQDLIIQPGTVVRLAPSATLVLKGRLLAEGTLERPIRFLSKQADQAPWGAIVLMGPGANGSRLTHCEMAGGSGQKGDLFEYSAMFSVHDVKGVSVKDCLFRDNRVVDDMVHTVYADIRFERTRFENAFADALDLDISEAVIIDSRFSHSGNDAVDLMTARAHISGSTFIGNGDKGISVGENSYLFAVDNCLIGNLIGVESKDRSTALLFNQTFKDNEISLHAYRKNWRYGTGGTIFLAKSMVSGSDDPVSAKKESSIRLFDSYLDRPLSGERIAATAVDGESRVQATQVTVLPADDTTTPVISQALQNLPAATLAQVAVNRRHAVCDG